MNLITDYNKLSSRINKIFKYLLLITSLGYILIYPHSAYSYLNNKVEQKSEISLFQKKLDALEITNNNETILLGIAEIYRVSRWSPTHKPFAKDYYQRVLEISPNNKAALTIFLRLEIYGYMDDFNNIQNEINISHKILAAKPDQYPLNSPYYDYANNYTPEDRKAASDIYKKRADEARKKLIKKETTLINMIIRAKSLDPGNAFYNYLHAAILIRNDAWNIAIEEIKKGLAKERVDIYRSERINARKKVLEDIDFPWPQRGELLMQDISIVGFVRNNITNPLLKRAAKLENIKIEQADALRQLVVRLGKQISKETFCRGEYLISLEIQKRGLQQQKSNKNNNKIVDIQNEITRIQKILSGPWPNTEKGSSLDNYKHFIDVSTRYGTIRALEEYQNNKKN